MLKESSDSETMIFPELVDYGYNPPVGVTPVNVLPPSINPPVGVTPGNMVTPTGIMPKYDAEKKYAYKPSLYDYISQQNKYGLKEQIVKDANEKREQKALEQEQKAREREQKAREQEQRALEREREAREHAQILRPPSRNPPIPPIDSKKKQLCVELFGSSDNGCLKLTMEQLDIMKWAIINNVYNRSGQETYETLQQPIEYFRRIRPVIGCLFDISISYGLLNRTEAFQRAFHTIANLVDPRKRSPITIFQEMINVRTSISDESFRKIEVSPAGLAMKVELIQEAGSKLPMVDFFPELYTFNKKPEVAIELFKIREKILTIYDCLISIMRRLYPTLGRGMRKLKTHKKKKTHNKTYKKKKSYKKYKKSYKVK
jgi:hypothetical protein